MKLKYVIDKKYDKQFVGMSSKIVRDNFYYREGEIWVREKVQPLKIINALFLEPHTRCYRM